MYSEIDWTVLPRLHAVTRAAADGMSTSDGWVVFAVYFAASLVDGHIACSDQAYVITRAPNIHVVDRAMFKQDTGVDMTGWRVSSAGSDDTGILLYDARIERFIDRWIEIVDNEDEVAAELQAVLFGYV